MCVECLICVAVHAVATEAVRQTISAGGNTPDESGDDANGRRKSSLQRRSKTV